MRIAAVRLAEQLASGTRIDNERPQLPEQPLLRQDMANFDCLSKLVPLLESVAGLLTQHASHVGSSEHSHTSTQSHDAQCSTVNSPGVHDDGLPCSSRNQPMSEATTKVPCTAAHE